MAVRFIMGTSVLRHNAADKLWAPQAIGSFIGLFDC